jgi:uncharacterized membrane protein YjjP (DUF1212 family)
MFIIYTLTMDLFVFIIHNLESSTGISLKATTCSTLFYTIPFGLILLQGKNFNFSKNPLTVCMLIFAVINLLYYWFYNQHATDLLTALSDGYMPFDWARLLSVINITLILLTTGKFLDSHENPKGFFELFCKYAFGIGFIGSLLAVIFYPLGILTVNVGIKRMALIFGHPNAFAHYLTALICFLLGAAFYFKSSGMQKFAYSIFMSLPLMFIGLATAGSKSPLFQTVLILGIITFLEIWLNKRRFDFLKNPKMLLIGGLTTVLLFFVLLQSGFIDNFQKRFSEDSSLQWRYRQWSRVIQNIDPDKIYFGHGHTAALGVAQRYVYNIWNMRVKEQESPYIHNTVLEHFYDYGLLGMIWIIGFLWSSYLNVANIMNPEIPQKYKSLNICCLALFLQQMLGLLFDECFYMPSPFGIWTLWGIMFYIATQSHKTVNKLQSVKSPTTIKWLRAYLLS